MPIVSYLLYYYVFLLFYNICTLQGTVLGLGETAFIYCLYGYTKNKALFNLESLASLEEK